MNIKVFITAPTYCLQTKNIYLKNGKVLIISLASLARINRTKKQKAWLKYGNNTFEWEIDIKNINTHLPRAHFIVT